MKILWITNIIFPEAEQKLTGHGELKSSGGWMLGAAEILQSNYPVDLYIATVSHYTNELKIIKGKKMTHYILPYGKGNLVYNQEYEPYWKYIQNEIQPDIVHIHGTEFTHGLAYIKACGNNKVVVSIQGLKHEYAKHYCAGMTNLEIYQHMTIRDLIKGNILSDKRKFIKSGECELELIRSINNIIGRTSWDRAHAFAINPNIHYYFCNETLRNEFYNTPKWEYSKCRKHSIFLSQAGYPIKGLHQVLKAMPLIIREYPNTQIRIAGYNITSFDSFSAKIRLSGYGRYIRKLIQQFNLIDHVTFIGNINATQMKEEYLNANVFICPSAIENSPNSLGEAQILGTPCIASYVGGVSDMMLGNEENLYRFEEIEMLAEKVCNIFANEAKQINMIETASCRHNQKINSEQLYNIYQSINKI